MSTEKPADAYSGAPKAPITDSMAKPLPRRFYKVATHGPVTGGFAILLDGRAAKTPAKKPLIVASEALAEGMAREWQAQVDIIDPGRMPLTTLVTTTIDAVVGQEAAVRAEIIKYAGSDLICYRAETPVELVAQQAASWDPLLAWAAQDLDTPMTATSGITFVMQDAQVAVGFATALSGLSALHLAATHVLTTMLGSAVLALAVARKHLTIDQAWQAAHIDEDWQIALWGEDADAQLRRARRRRDADAAATALEIG